MPKQNIIGPSVRQMRIVSGVSQDALAARCQRMGWALSRGTLAKIEARVRLVNDAEVLLLAVALAVSPEKLFPVCKRGQPNPQAIDAARHSND
jgi:transcriptional regulator with XRE-family HTH domain